MTLDVSSTALEILSEKGYDVRYGARPLKRTLARELLNPLSRLVLEGAVIDGDEVLVRSRGEAEKIQAANTGTDSNNQFPWGWISSNPLSEDKNDVVIIRNHDPAATGNEDDEDDYMDDEYGDFPSLDGTNSSR